MTIEQVRARWDDIAKPIGSLGELETLLTKIAAISGSTEVSKRAIIVLASDNGVTAQGIAATPPEITAVMSGFMAQRRSTVCVMANHSNCDVILRDVGMFTHVEGVEGPHFADGTADIALGAAMPRELCEQVVQYGIDLVRDAKAQGYNLLATGEMGIGNTTTSSAIASVLLGQSVETMTGRGAGLEDDAYLHKIEIVRRAIEVNRCDGSTDAMDVLARLGGFDIAGLCGVFIGGAKYGVPIIVDGFISSVAALCAARIELRSSSAMIASHVSAEPAAKMVLDALELKPIIHADMRLGEGTGAIALLSLIDLAKFVFDEMITYADIGM